MEFVNGGLESHNGLRVTGFNFHDKPGEVSFVDTNVFKEALRRCDSSILAISSMGTGASCRKFVFGRTASTA